MSLGWRISRVGSLAESAGGASSQELERDTMLKLKQWGMIEPLGVRIEPCRTCPAEARGDER